MKKIVLLGDSIRMGYDKYIKDALKNTAEVYYPEENCRFAAYILRYAHEWKSAGKWGDDVDLVHWNAGLWDALELFGDEPLTSLSYYGEAIARIDKRLRMLFPNAKILFATSTAVDEKKSSANFTRHNAIIEKYNTEAIRALSNTDTVINDLYSSDWVHYYTPKATEIIGGRVLSFISKLLGISPSQINIEDFQPERYSADNIGY